MKQKKQEQSNRGVDWDNFVQTWQESTTLHEVTEKLAITKSLASARAVLLRKKGVRLKQFVRGSEQRVFDPARLNKIIESVGMTATKQAS